MKKNLPLGFYKLRVFAGFWSNIFLIFRHTLCCYSTRRHLGKNLSIKFPICGVSNEKPAFNNISDRCCLDYFSFPAAAQFKETTGPEPKKTQVSMIQKKGGESSGQEHQSELDEALNFLQKISGDLSDLKVYKLADTNQSDIAPQIAADVIETGRDFARLKKIGEKVLQYHKLTEVCSVVLYKDKIPTVFTYRLRSISLSTDIFEKLTDNEAAALIAHETGQLHFAKELAEVRDTGDNRLARIIELKCDIIALITLKGLKIDPGFLTTALKKLIKARKKMGLQITTEQSPAMKDRNNLTELFLKQKRFVR